MKYLRLPLLPLLSLSLTLLSSTLTHAAVLSLDEDLPPPIAHNVAQPINLTDVVQTHTYSLTLSTDPTKVLGANDSVLVVETFEEDVEVHERWNAQHVGPHHGRRWQFHDADVHPTKYLYCVGGGPLSFGGGGYLKLSFRTIKTDGFLWLPVYVEIIGVPNEHGGGIKIQLHPEDNQRKLKVGGWMGKEGTPVFGEENAAIWKITHTTSRHHWMEHQS